jgi:hypothetical protein
MIRLPPVGSLAVPNPFCTNQLPFPPLVAGVGKFVIVFPESFPIDGVYFLAQVVQWEVREGESSLSYHLQHWWRAEEQDDPDGLLAESGYFVQCCGDCEDPQPCADCGTGCCWWETAGVVNVSSGIWSGSFHQVNFIGDDIAVRDFVCVDLAQSDIEQLWSQLPEVVEDLVIAQVPAAVPVLPHSLSLLCMNASSAAPVLNQVQGLPKTEGSEQELVVYTDG